MYNVYYYILYYYVFYILYNYNNGGDLRKTHLQRELVAQKCLEGLPCNALGKPLTNPVPCRFLGIS